MTTHAARGGHSPTTLSLIRRGPLPSGAYSAQAWRIHEIADDFDLEDVWALPVEGGPDDVPRVVDAFLNGDDRDYPAAYRFLFAARWALGGLLGVDGEEHGLEQRVESLRDRLPDDLSRLSASVPLAEESLLQQLYLTDREYAAEIANRTVHAVLHIGWVEDESARGGFSAQLNVLVRPNGLLGGAYMAFIKPFRYLVVYPAILRTLEQRWDRATETRAA